MMTRKGVFTFVAVLMVTLFLAGLIRMAHLSPATAYPAYSSLQSGPGGTKLLFEALANTGKVLVSRNYLPLSETKPSNSVVFYLGVTPADLRAAQTPLLLQFERLAAAGNRLVLGISNRKQSFKSGAETPIEIRWRIRVTGDGVFSPEDDRLWQRIADNRAMERQFGDGSIVLLPQAERLTNESLASDATARGVAVDLLGKMPSVVFEEAHLGIVETGSIAGLARQYHLAGFAVGLLLVACVFVWHRSWTFPLPMQSAEGTGSIVVAADARRMFTSLLERHIPPDRLLDICVAEWKRVHPAGRGADALTQVAIATNPIAAYRTIQNQLQCKKIVK